MLLQITACITNSGFVTNCIVTKVSNTAKHEQAHSCT